MPCLYAIGDMHGCLDAYTALLRAAGLIDSAGHWSGGRSILVQTGDLIDRGPRSIANLRLTRRLQEEAKAKGGCFEVLLGGHEVFALAAADGNDWALLSWFSVQNGGALTLLEWLSEQDTSVDAYDEESLSSMYGRFFAEFSSGGLGKWLRAAPTSVKIEDAVFVHAGISSDVPETAESLNEAARRCLSDLRAYLISQNDPVLGRRGPYWVRDIGADEVARALRGNGASRMICGHNPAPWVTSHFGGGLIVIDTGVVRGGPVLGIQLEGSDVLVFDGEGRRHEVDTCRRHDQPAARRAVAHARGGRFNPGDLVEFYHSPLTDGRAVLKVQGIWGAGKELYYSGPQAAFIPDRKGSAVRFNHNETWTYPAAFIERVGIPVRDALEKMPPELSRACHLLS